MSVLLLSAAFIVCLTAGGVWSAVPLLTGAADALPAKPDTYSADLDSRDAAPGFPLSPYGWPP